MATRMKLGCNFARYVSACSSTAASTRRETAMASLATRSFCTSARPTSSSRWIIEKTVAFIQDIGVPIIFPCIVIYWWDGKKERPVFHEKVAQLKEQFQNIRKYAKGQQVNNPMCRQEFEELEVLIESKREDTEKLQALVTRKWQEIERIQALLENKRKDAEFLCRKDDEGHQAYCLVLRKKVEKLEVLFGGRRQETAKLQALLERKRLETEGMQALLQSKRVKDDGFEEGSAWV